MSFDIQRADDALNRAAKLCLGSDPANAEDLRVALVDFGMLDGLPQAIATLAVATARSLRQDPPDLARAESAIGELQEALSVFSERAALDALGDAPAATESPSAAGSGEQPEEGAAAELDEPAAFADDAEFAAAPEAPEAPETPEAPEAPSGPVEPKAAEASEATASSAPAAERDAELVQEFTAECADHVEAAEAALLELERAPNDAELLNAVFRAFHTIKGGAGLFDLAGISGLAHSAETLLDAARQGQLSLADRAMELAFESLDGLSRLITELDAEPDSDPRLEEAPRLVEAIDAVLTGSPESGAEPAATVPAPPASEPAKRESSSSRAAAIKVPTDRLDSLIDLVGELVIVTSMVGQEHAQDSTHDRGQRSLGQLHKVTTELQSIAMSLRMVPFAATFQKASRTVRDLGQKSGKQVRLRIEGQETEIDRNVVEKLGDPLLHMLRNAVDHGLETPEERAAAGKAGEGQMVLRAFHQGGRVVLQLSDDGRGMDRQAILDKALSRDLITPTAAERLTDAEVYSLIFEAGFSTAAQVTEISGRGVGMDVVRKNVLALQGTIDIESELGVGTTFTIRLPLTLAIIDGIVVRIGQQRYILPTRSVDTFLRPKQEQVHRVQGKGECLSIRGKIHPMHRLYQVLEVEGAQRDPTRGLVAILEEEHGQAALLVDDLIGQQQVVIKSMGEGLTQAPGIAGAAILGDGTVGLILDGDGIVRLSRETELIHEGHEAQETVA